MVDILIYIHSKYIYAVLRDSESKEVLKKNITQISKTFSYDSWSSYFKTLETEWNWNIFREEEIKEGVYLKYLEEFVKSCVVSIEKENLFFKEICDSLNKFSLDLKTISLSKEGRENIFENMCSFLEYRNSLYIDINLRGFSFLKITNGERHRLEYNPVQLFDTQEYIPFISEFSTKENIVNTWGNFFHKPILKTGSYFLKDLVFSYILLNLLKTNINLDEKPSLIYITGDLIHILEFKKLLVAIIDGLELTGDFDICIDKEYLLYMDMKYPEPLKRIYIPSIDMRKYFKEVIFDGRLSTLEKKEDIKYKAISSEITDIPIPNPRDMFFSGKLLNNEISMKCFDRGLVWDRVVFDCRFKPVEYGPTSKENRFKFNVWFAGESYS